MKLAIVSDFHLGDPTCTLFSLTDKQITEGSRLNAFREAVGEDNDFLILAGDIFDFSVASYDQVYQCGKAFFQYVQSHNIAKQIILIAGNHDADLWHLVQHHRSLNSWISRPDKPDSRFTHSVPGVLDLRKNKNELILAGVTPNSLPLPKYGGLFLDRITNPATVFNFAYPNLYIVTDSECVLVTHGHYADYYWSFLSSIVLKIATDDAHLGVSSRSLNIEKLVELNYPLSQLACSGVGQAGCFTDWFRPIYLNIKRGNLEELEKYLNSILNELDKKTDWGWLGEALEGKALNRVKNSIIQSVRDSEEKPRGNPSYYSNKAVRRRLKKYLNASTMELSQLNQDFQLGIPHPSRIVFGHTHQPIGWCAQKPPSINIGTSEAPLNVVIHNTGGWLIEHDRFNGAEVFTYNGNRFSSVSVG